MALSKTRKIIFGVVAVLVLAGVVGFSVTKDSRNRIAVLIGKVGKQDLVSTVQASGEVKPKKFVNVSANVSGRITDLLVREGDRVKKGQVLARIDSTRFAANTRQSEAGLQAQRSELDRAVADLDVSRLVFERTKRMYAEKLIADQAYDQAQAEIRMKEAGVESLKRRITQGAAALESSRDDLEKTTVVAPMDGVVTNLAKEEGEMVIGAQSFQPTVIMTVGDLSVMECEIMVDETDIRNVTLGQAAEVRVDALEGIKIKGDVTEIGSSAIPRGGQVPGQQQAGSTANQAKDFRVKITLKDPPPSIRPGLNATADITTAKKEQVLSVPIQAIVVREVGKDGKVIDPSAPTGPGTSSNTVEPTARAKGEEKDGVFVVSNGQASFKPVKTGILGETDIEIVEGLSDGQEIVTGSYKTLRTLKDQARIKLEKEKKGRS